MFLFNLLAFLTHKYCRSVLCSWCSCCSRTKSSWWGRCSWSTSPESCSWTWRKSPARSGWSGPAEPGWIWLSWKVGSADCSKQFGQHKLEVHWHFCIEFIQEFVISNPCSKHFGSRKLEVHWHFYTELVDLPSSLLWIFIVSSVTLYLCVSVYLYLCLFPLSLYLSQT